MSHLIRSKENNFGELKNHRKIASKLHNNEKTIKVTNVIYSAL